MYEKRADLSVCSFFICGAGCGESHRQMRPGLRPAGFGVPATHMGRQRTWAGNAAPWLRPKPPPSRSLTRRCEGDSSGFDCPTSRRRGGAPGATSKTVQERGWQIENPAHQRMRPRTNNIKRFYPPSTRDKRTRTDCPGASQADTHRRKISRRTTPRRETGRRETGRRTAPRRRLAEKRQEEERHPEERHPGEQQAGGRHAEKPAAAAGSVFDRVYYTSSQGKTQALSGTPFPDRRENAENAGGLFCKICRNLPGITLTALRNVGMIWASETRKAAAA